jgi:hypothetical protein
LSFLSFDLLSFLLFFSFLEEDRRLEDSRSERLSSRVAEDGGFFITADDHIGCVDAGGGGGGGGGGGRSGGAGADAGVCGTFAVNAA